MNDTTSIPRVAPNAYEYVREVLDFGFHNAHSVGMTARLEQQFAARMGCRYGIAHCNGTATLQTALMAAGVGVGDEVVVPAFTVFSTPAAALQVNAVPIVADVDPRSWTLDPADVRRKITPRTKALIPVSIAGLMPDLDALMALAAEHGLVVVEDNAQGYLCELNGRVSGSIGHLSSFSFQASKTLSCGDGGILITDDDDLALAARRAATLGFTDLSIKPGDTVVSEQLRCHPSYCRHSELGWNQRLPELACAVALAELERLDELVAMRIAAAERFLEVAAGCEWLGAQHVPNGCRHTYWTLPMQILRDDIEWADLQRVFLDSGGDGFYGAYQPAHLEPVFANLNAAVDADPARYPQWAGHLPRYERGMCPEWERIQPRIIQLKTNYFSVTDMDRQARIFADTLAHFG